MIRLLHVTSLLLLLHVAGAVANTGPRVNNARLSHVDAGILGRSGCPRNHSKLYNIQLTDSLVHPVHSEVH